MSWLIWLYAMTLKLYPRPFRVRFAAEMEQTFRAGLEDARKEHALTPYVLREVLHLPGNLASAYMWFLRAANRQRMAVSMTGSGGAIGASGPGDNWSASLLAGLPHLLFGMVIVGTTALEGMRAVDQRLLGYLEVVVMAVPLLVVFVFSLHQGWRRWSGSWLIYMFMFGVVLLSLAVNALASSFTANDGGVANLQILLIPLLLGYILYKIACVDRLRGLLASVPAMVLAWSYFQEFVPALLRMLAWGWVFLLAFGASALMLRTRRFRPAVILALAVPVLGGFPFAYIGVYYGGTLPFSEPGPSLPEVWRQYLPFLAAAASIALGPQLAVKVRAIGYASAEAGGKIFYRLALGGVLLGLALTFLQWIIVTGAMPAWLYALPLARGVLLAGAVALYAGGCAWLVSAAIAAGVLPSRTSDELRWTAVFSLLPGVPAVIFLAMPLGLDRSPYYWIVLAAEIGWVLGAAWMADGSSEGNRV